MHWLLDQLSEYLRRSIVLSGFQLEALAAERSLLKCRRKFLGANLELLGTTHDLKKTSRIRSEANMAIPFSDYILQT